MALGNSGRKVMMVLESHYPTAGGGGAEGQLRTISRYLVDNGVEVQIVVPMREDGSRREHDEVDGIPVWRISFPKLRKIGGLVLLTRLAWGLFRKRREYQVIHAHIAHNMAAVCSAVGSLLGKTVIVKITGSRELSGGVLDPDERSFAIVVKRWALRRVTYFQATSQRISDRLAEQGFDRERVRIIPNAVDVDRFAQTQQLRAEECPDALTAVYVGRLEPAKGVDNLVAAWIKAFPAEAQARLLIVGEGSQRADIEAHIRSAGRGEQIRLLGAQDDVQEFFAKADFAVLPSRYEGLSNALLEAMAAGLPVLGTRVSGTEDFLGDGQCGWMVEPDSVESLVSGLITVKETGRAELGMKGEHACQRVASRARIDAVAAQLAKLYEIDSEHFRSIRHSQYT